MSDDVTRNKSGQFAPGQSGNSAGARSRRRKELLTPADVHGEILRVAGSETKMTVNGKIETVTMLTRNIMALSSGSANRAAAKDIIDFTLGAAWFFQLKGERDERKAMEQARRERGS